jgi:hypothetical protein
MPGVCSDDRCGALTTLDNTLTVSWNRAKRELIVFPLTQEGSKKEWHGDTRNLTAADFAEAFRQWYECSEKCAAIASGNVEKT